MAFTGKATYGAGPALPELVEDVSDVIGIVSPHETPLLDHLGDAKRPATSTVHEWIEDALIPTPARSTTRVAGADTEFMVSTSRPSRSAISSDPPTPARSCSVTAIDPGSSSLTVTRGYGGTTPATLATRWRSRPGQRRPRGADAPAARFTAASAGRTTRRSFTASVDVSGSMQAAAQHGIADEVDYQKQERMRELLRDLENTVINGVAPSADQQGLRDRPSTMNGIIHSITTNTFRPGVGGMPQGDSGALDEALLNAAMRAVWQQSLRHGQHTIVCGGKQKRRINSFATGARAYLPEDTRFADMVSVLRRATSASRASSSAAGCRRHRPPARTRHASACRPLQGRSFHYKPLAATGDSVSGQVIGEYTLEFKNEKRPRRAQRTDRLTSSPRPGEKVVRAAGRMRGSVSSLFIASLPDERSSGHESRRRGRAESPSPRPSPAEGGGRRAQPRGRGDARRSARAEGSASALRTAQEGTHMFATDRDLLVLEPALLGEVA